MKVKMKGGIDTSIQKLIFFYVLDLKKLTQKGLFHLLDKKNRHV